MKAIELMIGDWILCSDNIQRQVRYLQVRPSVIGIGGSSYDEDEIQPIPLTPEILEKNGFEVFDFKDLVYYESDDKRIKATNSEGMKNTFNEWYIHVDTKDMRTMAYGEVTYVHEFQHLLRLCGIDKEITL